MTDENVKLELSRDEALVLYDFLSRFSRDKSLRIEDQAEESHRIGFSFRKSFGLERRSLAFTAFADRSWPSATNCPLVS